MTTQELWEAVLGELEVSISKASFTTWFKNTAVKSMDDSQVVVLVPNIFAKEWLEKKYKKEILDSVRRFFPKINSLACSIGSIEELGRASERQLDSATERKAADQRTVSRPVSAIRPAFLSNLNPRYEFDSFVVSSNNELAHAACRSVAENPGENYNPLFIYGGVGLGKTHLLQSVGNYVLNQNPAAKVRYNSMERFTNELIDALQNSKAKEFKNNYIQVDVLIIDDVQFLTNKEKTQEEFFHVFEALYNQKKQIILSSDRPPKSIPTLEDRLRSRFEGGMIADVGKPDLETRIAIIQKKLDQKNFALDGEIVSYLAENIHHNVRELEGALNKIIATFQLKNEEATIEEVINITKDLLSVNRQKNLTTKKIIGSVADYYDVKPEEISSRCRKNKVVKPRQVAIYLIRNEISLSFPEIGQIIGGRDHSTAIYAYEKIKKEIEENELLQDQVKFIREKFIEY